MIGLPFGPYAIGFIVLYLCSLLLVGWLGFRARQSATLRDHYLGGGFGLIVLPLTLYATQYSGNSLFANVGATVRSGYTWLISLQYMLAIVAFYLCYALPLYRRSVQRGYVTPSDFVADRYRSLPLKRWVAAVMIAALSIYLLGQLMAIGRALQGLSADAPDQAYTFGVIGLALVMLGYGTLGGMRAVAWTDVIQGLMLALGFTLLFVVLRHELGAFRLAGEQARALHPAAFEPPSGDTARSWYSYILLVGIGAALYPQAIQRIYAARSERVLRRSLVVMVLIAFPSVLATIAAGIYAIAWLPTGEGAAADQALGQLLALVYERSWLGSALVVVMFAAILAAIMSTADSALLAISSMLTQDFGRDCLPQWSERSLLTLSKCLAAMLLAVMVLLSLILRDKATLISLIDRKFDLLVQLAPTFMLGVHWRKLNASAVVAGLITGLVIALILAFVPLPFVENRRVAGIHPGLIGLAANIAVVILMSFGKSAGRQAALSAK